MEFLIVKQLYYIGSLGNRDRTKPEVNRSYFSTQIITPQLGRLMYHFRKLSGLICK